MIVMQPKSFIRIGYLFVIVGVLITALLIYQTKDCPDSACILLLSYLSLVIMVTAVVIFILTYLFAMRIWLKRKHFKEEIPNVIYGKQMEIQKRENQVWLGGKQSSYNPGQAKGQAVRVPKTPSRKPEAKRNRAASKKPGRKKAGR